MRKGRAESGEDGEHKTVLQQKQGEDSMIKVLVQSKAFKRAAEIANRIGDALSRGIEIIDEVLG